MAFKICIHPNKLTTDENEIFDTLRLPTEGAILLSHGAISLSHGALAIQDSSATCLQIWLPKKGQQWNRKEESVNAADD